MSEPSIVEFPDRPYVGIRRTVTMQRIPEVADRIPGLFGWLGSKGVAPAGPPILRYHVVDMDHELDLEAGVPVESAVPGEGEVVAGVLPAGRYATMTHVGPYDGLHDATAALLKWADEQGLRWDAEGRNWGCRIESYLTNPAEQPDPSTWETELQFRLADQ